MGFRSNRTTLTAMCATIPGRLMSSGRPRPRRFPTCPAAINTPTAVTYATITVREMKWVSVPNLKKPAAS
jgi:hypothetical protein